MNYPIVDINWSPAFRIIPTRFPSIYLYDRVADHEEFEILYEIEAMTNSRLRDEIGELNLVPAAERLYGSGTGPIMSAFTHLNPLGSRFSDGKFGVFYAARERETAIAETRFHSESFMRATKEDAKYLQMRLYTVQVVGPVADVRLACKSEPEILSKESYSYAQHKGILLRSEGANGVLYPSVRNPGGECIGAFKTTILRDCFHAAYLEYHWDGHSINYVTEQIQ